MQWLTLTHTQQYHVKTHTIVHGHIYQSRYKSFLIEKDRYLLAAIKYVERNSVRAYLSKTFEGWRWGSGYRRLQGTATEQKLLSLPPSDLPKNYSAWINQPDKEVDLTRLRVSVFPGSMEQKRLLYVSPTALPKRYVSWINEPENKDILDELRRSVLRGVPFGDTAWVDHMT